MRAPSSERPVTTWRSPRGLCVLAGLPHDSCSAPQRSHLVAYVLSLSGSEEHKRAWTSRSHHWGLRSQLCTTSGKWFSFPITQVLVKTKTETKNQTKTLKKRTGFPLGGSPRTTPTPAKVTVKPAGLAGVKGPLDKSFSVLSVQVGERRPRDEVNRTGK